MNELTPANQYGFQEVEKQKEDDSSLMQSEQSRAVAEVQAAYVIAKRFPRNESESFAKIMKACKRPFLAEQSIYAYPKGGKIVDGASIRMAEVLLQAWGNCDAGIEEISQNNGVSIAKAYAIDYETNTRITKIFHVSHTIGTKKGPKKLTDPRDIYENMANQGARRMRACILGIIPGDIVDAALEECKKTLTNGAEPLTDRIRKLVMAFDELGVKVEHLEKRLGHKLDATIEAELITLRGIYKSLKDGMAKREDFFEGFGNDEVVDKLSSIANKKNETVIIDKETGEVKITFAEVKKQLLMAKNIDALAIAADMIREIVDGDKEALEELFKNRKEALKG